MTTELNTAVGLTDTVTTFGDSLMQGSGGTGLAQLLTQMIPARLFINRGIGGQTSQQIAARQGGRPAPIRVSLTGNVFNGINTVTLTSVSPAFLSTQADNGPRVMSGSINGIQCAIFWSATGTAPSQVETYTVMPAAHTTAAVPAGSVFIPDDGFNARRDIQILWFGRNDTDNWAGLPALYAGCVSYLAQPRRFAIIGILPAPTETPGTAARIALDAANAATQAAYPDNYIPPTPPTVAELAAIGYTPTTQDNTDIANGLFPTGLRSSGPHLTTPGYQVFANRVAAFLTAKGW
jgi:lysophospholipase L1-like esterase